MNVIRYLKGCISGALLLSYCLASPQANASLIFDFNQVGTATRNVFGGSGAIEPSYLVFSAQLVVTDDAYARGFTFSQSNGYGPTYANLDGLLSFTTATLGGRPTRNGVLFTTVADYTENFDPMYPGWGYRPGSGRFSSISLSFSRDTGLTGNFYYNTSDFDYRISVIGTHFVGDARTDYGTCFIGCDFTGSVTTMRSPGNSNQLIAVPEPTSLALFTMGLVGVFSIRTLRRRTAP